MQPSNCVEIHFDDECDLLHEEPSSLNRLEKSEDLPVPSLQANCKPDVDCPGVATEQLASSSCSLHGASVGDEDSEECLKEASNLVSASAMDEDKLSDADSDHVIEEVAPEDNQQILPSSSPTKGLNVNESSASGNLEKGEQPSPISVLDIPSEEDTFQEETPSLKRFEEISSNLQELRTRLHLLKFDSSESLQHNSENVLTGEATVLEDHDMEEIGIDSKKTCDSPSEAAISPASRSSCPETEIMDVGSVMLNSVLCPQEKWADLQYVRNSLVASGFTGNADAIFAKWHSPNHPMDPHLYEKLQDNDLSTTDSVSERERIESEQHLLFDCTNEVLLAILGPFFYPCPWVKPSKGKLQHVMPVSNQLLEETWRKLSNLYPQSGMDYTLENIVAKDINREGTWLELQDDVEMVGVELEKIVCDDLIEEICCDLINI
uniref:DUF4378 domain-containing protein n=1 Tax=Araucaria cunninghamii TaxID=56994 RepID=A0A0D6R6C4_ARACU